MMKTILKRAAAIMTLVAFMLLMMPAERIAAEDNNKKSYRFTRSISDAPMSPMAGELHKGVTYYAWFRAQDGDTDLLLDDSVLPFTVEAQVINPDGEIVKSIVLDTSETYTDELVEEYGAAYFYIPFEPDMLGTWTTSVTYHIKNEELGDFGPYTVQKECTVPSAELTVWLSYTAMGEAIPSVRLGNMAFLCYALRDTETGEILDDRITGYTVTMEIIDSDGKAGGIPYTGKSASDYTLVWPADKNGTWRAVIKVEGDISERIELNWYAGRLLGDVNGDNVVDASDAAEILTESAVIGAGSPGTFSAEQNTAADVDRNDTIDASDAAAILIYAAAIGSGNFSGTLEESMQNND